MSAEREDAAFYRKHYSDWTVHALSLTVRVPMTKGSTEADALELVREILSEAAFDIRVTDALAKPERDEESGLHACTGCGLELDGDDSSEKCDECEQA